MLAHLSFDQLLQVIRNGGGAEINAGTFTQEQRVQLAANTAQGATLIFANSASMSAADILHIARNGAARVLFR